jgi:hypothetical protein
LCAPSISARPRTRSRSSISGFYLSVNQVRLCDRIARRDARVTRITIGSRVHEIAVPPSEALNAPTLRASLFPRPETTSMVLESPRLTA